MWRLGGFGLILDVEYGCCKKISAVYGFVWLRGCGRLEFKLTVCRLSLTSQNLLLDNRYYLSGLRIAVTERSSQIVDSDKLP